MATLFGRNYTRQEVLQRVGDVRQVGGVRLIELADGLERGVRALLFRTGAGLDFTVLADRGMDIGQADYCGAALAYNSPTTWAAAAYYEPEGLGWLRGFGAGLLTTCGFAHFGPPVVDGSQALGLHGRASYIPAANVAYGGTWDGDEYEMWASGEVREASVFGENLVLRRRISARLGGTRLAVEDVVTNEGWEPAPFMLLYHCNFGFPLVSEETELRCASAVRPRDADAAAGLADHARFQAPQAGYREQVFYHTPAADKSGWAQATLANPSLAGGLSAYVRFRPAQLPCLAQWKMMGQGLYVCGLEPATNWVSGRVQERAEGRLTMLAPGETRSFRVELGVAQGSTVAG